MSCVFEKIEGRYEESNYALRAYDLLSRKSSEDRERLYNILMEIEALVQK